MTDGPFYPPRAWREAWPDQDADLSRVAIGSSLRSARGEHLGLELMLADTQGRVIDKAEVEIWQCDALQAYRHPSVKLAAGQFDEGFQGFGATRSNEQGHIKLRHASFGELSSQLFVAGEPGNGRDFLWRALPAADREALEMKLLPADTDNGLRWQVRQRVTVPA
jgi:protocatechuate 3,4-dioxygenase beta subunit